MDIKKVSYKGYEIFFYDIFFCEVGKKIIDKEYLNICMLKDTKRNFVSIIDVEGKKYVFKEPRNEYIIPQRKLMTLFKDGEAVTTLKNLNYIRKYDKIDNFVEPYLAITKRKHGMICYSALVMENVDGKEDRNYLDDIVKLMVKVHKAGYYHGDFNPGNFLLEKGKIRIIDTQGKKMKFFDYRAHYDMLTMKMDSYHEMLYPYKKNMMYFFVFCIKKLKKLKVIEYIKSKKKELRERGWKI